MHLFIPHQAGLVGVAQVVGRDVQTSTSPVLLRHVLLAGLWVLLYKEEAMNWLASAPSMNSCENQSAIGCLRGLLIGSEVFPDFRRNFSQPGSKLREFRIPLLEKRCNIGVLFLQNFSGIPK